MSWTATLTLRPWTSLKTPSWTPSSSNRNRVATGRSPPSGVLSLLAILAHRLPRSIVHGHHGPHHPDAIHVLQVEQVVERPVQVVGQKRYLLPERFGGVTHHCVVTRLLLPARDLLDGSAQVRSRPRLRRVGSRLLGSRWGPRVLGRRARPGRGRSRRGDAEEGGRRLGVDQRVVLLLAAEVDDSVEVLEEGQVHGEETLDDVRVHLVERAQRLHHPAQHQDREPRVVGSVDARVAQRLELVAGCRQPHHARPVHLTRVVDVPARQGELVRGLEAAHLTRARLSTVRVMVSLTGSFDSTLSWSVAILLGQPLVKLKRAISVLAESYMTMEPFLRLFDRSLSRMPLSRMSLNQPHILSCVMSGGAMRVRLRSGALLALPSVLITWTLPFAPACSIVTTSISMSRPDTLDRMLTTLPSISRKKFWETIGSVLMSSALGIGYLRLCVGTL